MRFSVKFTASSLLIVIILATIFSVASQLQVPEWILQFTFYAFMTALFGFVFGVLLLLVRDRISEGKLKRARKLENLDAMKAEYLEEKIDIERIVKNAEKNSMMDSVPQLATTINMDELRFPEKLQEEITKYGEKIKDYNIFQKASEVQIRNTIKDKIRRMFPRSLGKYYELSETFSSDLLVQRCFDGESVTESWLKETQPIVLKNILKSIDESERHELDILFNEMNNDFKKEEILLRFRRQKETVVYEGKKILENLSKEIASIDKQLQEYDYLREYEEE